MDQDTLQAALNASKGQGSAPPPNPDPGNPPPGTPPPNPGNPAPGTPPPSGTPPGTPPPPTPPTEDEFEELDLERLGVESAQELYERLERFKELEQQYSKGPEFANEQQRKLYEFASRFEGKEGFQAARTYLDIVSSDLNAMPDQQKRYEAFRLENQDNGLTQEELRALFEEQEAAYGIDPSGDTSNLTVAQQARLKMETRKATEYLTKLQTEWEQSRPQDEPQYSPEEIAQARQQRAYEVSQELSGKFSNVTLNVSAKDENGNAITSAINYAIDGTQDLPALSEAIADPPGWWDTVVEKHQVLNPDGSINTQNFANLVTKIEKFDRMVSLSYQQGRDDAYAALLQSRRNLKPGDPGYVEMAKGDKDDTIKAAMTAAGYIKP